MCYLNVLVCLFLVISANIITLYLLRLVIMYLSSCLLLYLKFFCDVFSHELDI